MGFLTLGPRFIGDTHAIIDDRIDVVSRGLMGMTTACAAVTITSTIRFRFTTTTRSMASLRAATSRRICLRSVRRTHDLARVSGVRRGTRQAQQGCDRLSRWSLQRAAGAFSHPGRRHADDAGEEGGNVPARSRSRTKPPLRDKQLELWQKYLERELKPESRIWSHSPSCARCQRMLRGQGCGTRSPPGLPSSATLQSYRH